MIEKGRAQLISRNGNPFASFANLAEHIASGLHMLCSTCVDRKGWPLFRDLLFRRGEPCYLVLDLLFCTDRDCRREQLTDRKQELRRLLTRLPADSRLRYLDHIERAGVSLSQRVCELDLEGIVAKHKFAPYVSVNTAHGSRNWGTLAKSWSRREGRG